MNCTKECYLGIDVGSVSTNLVLIDSNDIILWKLYLRTDGQPIEAIKQGLRQLVTAMTVNMNKIGTTFDLSEYKIMGVGATGSGRQLARAVVGADISKNEITSHAVAAQRCIPSVRTIIEIGGQDSKIILLRDGIVHDFAMNTVCAAGTGSFLDRQAARLLIPIEDFGAYALRAQNTVRIAGRCAVFAESDMIHKQQLGFGKEDIINGLCEALVRNYIANLAKGKRLETPIVFQGGVAANIGIKKAFERALDTEIIVPKHYDVMGAYGAAILAKEQMQINDRESSFHGFKIIDEIYSARSCECSGCTNSCEIIQIFMNNRAIASWGDRCGKWQNDVG